MADGLFFTGTVFKNNRNLIQEANARQQLAMQEEQLNMKKQEAAERRAKARKDELKGYKVESDISQYGDPRFKKIMIDQAAKVNKFVSDNADNISDPDIQIQLQQMKDSTILLGGYLSQLDSKLTVLDPTNDASKNIRFKSDEEGNNLFETNLNNVVSSLNDGTFDLNARIASFAEDFQESIHKDMPTPDYQSQLDEVETQYTDAEGNVFKGLAEKDKVRWKEDFINNHIVNVATGGFKTAQAENTYMVGETFIIDGDSYSGIQAFFKEKKGIQNVEGIYEQEEAALDPSNKEFFDEKLHLEYVNYLADKIWERESKGRKQMITKEAKQKGDAVKLDEAQIAALETTNFEEGEVYGDVKLKGGELLQNIGNVEVDVNPAMLLDGQGDIYDQFVEAHKAAVGRKDRRGNIQYDEKQTVKAEVTFVGVSTDNKPVAKIEYNEKVYLLPLDKVASIIEKSGKAGKGRAFEILQYSKMLQAGEESKSAGATTNPAPR